MKVPCFRILRRFRCSGKNFYLSNWRHEHAVNADRIMIIIIILIWFMNLSLFLCDSLPSLEFRNF